MQRLWAEVGKLREELAAIKAGGATGDGVQDGGMVTGSFRAPVGPFPGDDGLPPDDSGPSVGS